MSVSAEFGCRLSRRVAIPVCLGDQPRPITDGADEVAVVNEVEGVAFVGPLALGVVDFEAAIWRNPFRLYGTEIGADDLCHS